MKKITSLIIASLVAMGTSATVSFAADPVAATFADAGICASDKVLKRISHRFDYQVRNVPNLPPVNIVDFYGIKQTSNKHSAINSPIDRQFCHATVALSDGHNRDVWYVVEKPMGFASIGSKVEFCIAEFDRWNVYGGRCQALR